MNRYQWNRSLIEPFTRMSLWGLRYDSVLAASMRAEQLPRAWAAQAVVDEIAGVALPPSTEALLSAVGEAHCHSVKLRKQLKGYKEMRPVLTADGFPKVNAKGKPVRKAYEVPPRSLSWELLRETANLAGSEPIARLRDLAESEPSASARAEMASLLGLSINVESPDQVIDLLDRLGLPAKWKRGARRDDDPDAGRTGDEEALLELFIRTSHPITKAILEARGIRGSISWLDSTRPSVDGRMRCSISNPASETGRVLTRQWHDRTGGNLQATSKPFRHLFRADPGCVMAQWDLKNADGWTVAARCALQGDPTMLEDLKAGIRIPSLLALMMGGAHFPSGFDRAELRRLCKTVTKDWRDIAFKVGQHGSNYGGSPQLIQRTTVKETWFATGTPMDPGLPFCQQVQGHYHGRYWGIKRWWNDCERQARRTGTLECASGQVREFLSRRWVGEGANRRLDHSTLKEFIASEPQAVTTFVTNLALWRLWRDPHNWPDGRVGDPHLTPYVQPLLHVHDSLLVQFREEHLAVAGKKLAEWFNNPLRIGNITISIPVESGWGPSWGECDQPFPP